MYKTRPVHQQCALWSENYGVLNLIELIPCLLHRMVKSILWMSRLRIMATAHTPAPTPHVSLWSRLWWSPGETESPFRVSMHSLSLLHAGFAFSSHWKVSWVLVFVPTDEYRSRLSSKQGEGLWPWSGKYGPPSLPANILHCWLLRVWSR